ncbi:1-phosphatidylinositol 4 5-bisphosphate phosphodiesterase gamma-1 [Biomphalaria pfeifferi]|uniref:1-phosphatidylinositol 4 5-bisphosphate phosphodiesterase gamma-1 n=1 Tax=Biomphalaria pfeifferi TaxID=112525 RepID=A0AAD8B4J7_BIOPF|nr:1-phosphatidylinositol 4 5-bisphosphate phosphodiesterase gamma-1 [Biomphalaria pfeifferi]
MASIMVNGGPPSPDLVEIMRLLEMGLVTTIFFYRKRPERKTLKVKLESRQFMWIKTQAGRPEGVASLRDVKEFRCGKNSRDFEKWPEEAKKVDSRITFTIYYGNDFKLKSLSVVANDANEFGMWRKGLDYLVKESKEASYQLQCLVPHFPDESQSLHIWDESVLFHTSLMKACPCTSVMKVSCSTLP